MPIHRNAGGQGARIEAGQHLVVVVETMKKMNRSNMPMRTVTFQDASENQLKGYYCDHLAFQMKHLELLKVAAGLKPTDHADELIGRQVGILVEPGKPNEEGRIFMQIVGYGPASDVEGVPQAEKDAIEVPF